MPAARTARLPSQVWSSMRKAPFMEQRNRDSLALDAVEPVRGDVDAFLLDLLEDREVTARDFGELPNGICRIAAPLNARTRTHAAALARMPAADRGAPRANVPRIAAAHRLAHSRLNPVISAAAFRVRSDRRCSRRLARPRSRGLTLRGHGARLPSKPLRPIRLRARYAASRCSSAGVVIARRACR
jgi:hypothetical protein